MNQIYTILVLLLVTSTPYLSSEIFQVTSDGCGDTKGCIRDPVDCNDVSDCEAMVTFSETADGTSVTFELLGELNQDTGYVAMGFSYDQKMGGDEVYACISGEEELSRRYNFVTVTPPSRSCDSLAKVEGTISSFNQSIVDSVIQCSFTRVIYKENPPVDFADLNMEYFILVARGPLLNDDLTYHDSRISTNQLIDVTSSKIDIGFREAFGTSSPATVTADGCGESKGCIRDDRDCNDVGDCTAMVTFAESDDGSSITFELIGNPEVENGNGYVAMGFSYDQKMGLDEVYSCVTGETNVIRTYNYVNSESHSSSPLDIVDGTISDFAQSVVDGVIQCSFTRVKENPADNFYDLNKNWYILVARGQAAGTPLYHYNNKGFTKEKISVTNSKTNTGLINLPSLYKVHGSLMVIGWLLCANTAIVIARYFKQVWPKSKLLGEKIWFTLHRSLMITNLCCFCTAFIVIFIQIEGFVETSEKTVLAHAILGIITVSLGITNPVIAIFRCHPGDSKRPIFNWLHFSVGITAMLTSITCVFLGIDLKPLDLPQHTTWVMVAYVCFTALIVCIFEIIGYRVKKLRKEYGGVPMSSFKGDPDDSPEIDFENPLEKKMKILLTFYGACVLAMAIYFVVFICIHQ